MSALALSHLSISFSDKIVPVPVPVNNGVAVRRSVSVPRHRAFKCASVATDQSLVEINTKEASSSGKLFPLHTSIFSDHLTPILAYRCLVKEGDLEGPSFLFESVLSDSQDASVGRYSIVGAQPCLEIVAKENKVITMDHEKGLRTEESVEDPMVIPRRIAEGWKPQLTDELPDVFCGGWVGFYSNDMVHSAKEKKMPFSKAPDDYRNLADIHLALYDNVIVFDHVQKKVHVIHWVRPNLHSSSEKAFVHGMKQLEILLSRVQDIDPPKLSSGSVESHVRGFGSPVVSESCETSQAFKKAVVRAKPHILAGGILQNRSSHCLERRTFADPFEVYRAFRVVNPSPFMGYLQARGCIVLASSPETPMPAEKVKAREFIDEREESSMGRACGGGVGSISLTDDKEIALSPRTIVFPTGNRRDTLFSYKDAKLRREWVAYFQAGAGIAARDRGRDWDCDCDCESRAQALARALDLAEAAFVKK